MGRIVTHKNTKRIWLYDYNQFAELSDCRDKIICLSDRDINLIWNAIQNIWTIRGRVYINANGNQYEMVDDTQWETFVNWVATMRNNLGEWPVCNDILQSMANSLNTIANRECCPAGGTGGSRGSGTIEVPPNPYDQEETPTEPPEGFSTMEQYESHKCNAANDIINSIGADLLSLSALTYAAQPPTGITAILITILLTPIPYDDLIALAAYLIYSAIAYSFLAEMAAQIELNRDDLLCTLFNAPTVETAKTNFLSDIQEIAEDQGWTSPQIAFVVGAVEYFLVNDLFNRLFENLPTVSQGIDCSSCEPCGILFDFAEDLEGWALVSANCNGNAENGTGSLVWSADFMELTVDAGAGTRAKITQVTGLSQLISMGTLLRVQGINQGASSNFGLVSIVTDAGCHVLTSTSWPGDPGAVREWDLSAFAGETIEEIEIYINNSVGGQASVAFGFVEVVC